MTYIPLTSANKVIDWARTLVTTLIQRDTAVDKRMSDLEARVTALEKK